MARLCPVCKRTELSYAQGSSYCSTCATKQAMFKTKELFQVDDFSSQSYSVFVGRFGYPNINVGILSTPDIVSDPWLYDAPNYWAEHNFSIPQVTDLRYALLNSRFKANIKDVRKHERFLDVSKEVAMAEKPADVDIHLDRKPHFRLQLDTTHLPMGPKASLKQVELTSNPKISQKVDKAVSDTDFKAQDALNELYERGIDENALQKLLSIGNLGVKAQRKLVPTRYAITAVDDNVGKHLIEEIKGNSNTTGYEVYAGSYLGNNFLFLCFPDVWGFELFEMFIGNAERHSTDFEFYEGRKNYAETTAGGYYAARLPLLEKLSQRKRQSSVLTIRVIDEAYNIPLGVWVVRSAARKAMASKPLEFGSKELMLEYVKQLTKRKFNMDIGILFKKSRLLTHMRSKLTNYL